MNKRYYTIYSLDIRYGEFIYRPHSLLSKKQLQEYLGKFVC